MVCALRYPVLCISTQRDPTRRLDSSVVERTIAARQVPGSNPGRDFFFYSSQPFRKAQPRTFSIAVVHLLFLNHRPLHDPLSRCAPPPHHPMFIEEIIIDGFKSYATRTVVSGFDPCFNAITGLNGSGKSNILDAICFVLGIRCERGA